MHLIRHGGPHLISPRTNGKHAMLRLNAARISTDNRTFRAVVSGGIRPRSGNAGVLPALFEILHEASGFRYRQRKIQLPGLKGDDRSTTKEWAAFRRKLAEVLKELQPLYTKLR
jgi:hypothetical protein